MGYTDPDHQHNLECFCSKDGPDCFRCELPFHGDQRYGCIRCDHSVHRLCLFMPQNMTHPLHPQHSLTLLSPSIISSSRIVTENCDQCLKPFRSGYAYHCQTCLKFNLHLKCFQRFNLETKHHHPLNLCDFRYKMKCYICGILIDDTDMYYLTCENCDFSIHFECVFTPPTVKHRHVHELTFECNYPEGCKVVDCDVCLNKDGKELDRELSYYYCKACDYIAHVRCVTSQPAKVTTQFDPFIHEHPMIFAGHDMELHCAACKDHYTGFYYFCSICNYALHKSCAEFPRFIKHPHHEENHILSLQPCTSQNEDYKLACCEFCNEELEGKGWIFQCSDCKFAVHMSCARNFKHPLYEDGSLYVYNNEEKFRCEACGELGDGFGMFTKYDNIIWEPGHLHLECFSLPGQIEYAYHSHPLYLVNSPTEIESYSSSVFQCNICHTEADPDFWVYCCEKCKYIAHLKCVVSDLLPAPGQSCFDFSNFCSIAIPEKEKFRVRRPELQDCSKLLCEPYYNPVFLPHGLFFNMKPQIGERNGRTIIPDVTDSDKSLTNVLCCPKCEKQISAPAYSSVWDWVHLNLKSNIYYKFQTKTRADYESLALLDEKVVDELYCPICKLLIFPPTYSCNDCHIFFHKSCAELPRKYTVDGGHTFVLQSPSVDIRSLSNCSRCQHPCIGYAYFCITCEIVFDITCALGAPLLKPENQEHCFFAMTLADTGAMIAIDTEYQPNCNACHHCHTKGNIYFVCGAFECSFNLHIECAMLPHVVEVKHKIHQHPLVLERHLDLSVDDYICDVCEKKLNPWVWVYRCSDSCGDRATFHVSCIVTSNKKCHFVYDEECSYPHLDKKKMTDFLLLHRHTFLQEKKTVPALAAAILDKPLEEEYWSVHRNLLSYVDELEHEYAGPVTEELMKMDQTEVFHLMESPDSLRAKVAEIMKDNLRYELPNTDKEENVEDDEDH